MFKIPSGINRSIDRHNSNLPIFCDWIEGSTLFIDEEISTSDIVDALVDEGVYVDSDFAMEFIENAWQELRHRMRSMGRSATFSITNRSIIKRMDWRGAAAHSFCLVLSLAPRYGMWVKKNKGQYIKQGKLFESLTLHSLGALGWKAASAGWTGDGKGRSFDNLIKHIAAILKEPIAGNLNRWKDDDAQDAGLDIVFQRPFIDEKGGKPVYLMQCASGYSSWDKKLHTPSLEVWKKLIDFSSSPQKAFAMPFTIEEGEFHRVCNRIEGVLFDRYRLLSAGSDGSTWLPAPLRKELVTWSDPHIKDLLRLRDDK